jgi:hypothetical protein
MSVLVIWPMAYAGARSRLFAGARLRRLKQRLDHGGDDLLAQV